MSQKMFGIWLVIILICAGGYYGYTQWGESSTQPRTSTQAEEQADAPAAAKVPGGSEQKITGVGGSGASTSANGGDNAVGGEKETDSSVVEIGEINAEMKGQNATIVGKIIKVSEGKGHVFFTVQAMNSKVTIKGVLFSSDAAKNPARAEVVRSAHSSGAPVHVTGKIDVYEGALEIKARKIFTE